MKLETIRRKARARYNRRIVLGDCPERAAYNALQYINAEFDTALNGTYGVETINSEYPLSYVNTGDSYRPTILWDSKTKLFHAVSWGDLIERHYK